MTSPVVQSASSQLHGHRSSMAVHGPMFVIGSSIDSSWMRRGPHDIIGGAPLPAVE